MDLCNLHKSNALALHRSVACNFSHMKDDATFIDHVGVDTFKCVFLFFSIKFEANIGAESG